MQNMNENNDFNELEETTVMPKPTEQPEDVGTEDDESRPKTITIFGKTFPKKKTIITAGLCAALVVVAVGGGVYYSATTMPEHVPVTAQTSSESDSETEEVYLPIEVTADGWDKDTSTPVIAHIVSDDGKIDFYHAFNANEQADIALGSEGSYTVSFISPINSDGSIYHVSDPVTIDTGGKTSTVASKVTFEKVSASDATTDEITNLIKDIAEAIKKGDETLVGENGAAIVEKAETNAKTNKNVDTDAVTETAKAAETTAKETTAADTGAKKNNSSSKSSSSSSNNSTASGNTSYNSSNQGSSHTHNWVAQTKTVHHDAVTVHHDAVTVWVEPTYKTHSICSACGADITGNEDSHIENSLINGDGTCWHYYMTDMVDQEGYWKTTQAAYDETVQAAYDETVTTGYKCSSCGATK